jgi:hypothetical protein
MHEYTYTNIKQISLHFKHTVWYKTPSNAKHTHHNKPTRVAARLTAEMADYDKYIGARVVWLLDLSYKNTDREGVSKHNHPSSVTDCKPALRRHYDFQTRTYLLSYVSEFYAGPKAGLFNLLRSEGQLRQELVCMRATRKSIRRIKSEFV